MYVVLTTQSKKGSKVNVPNRAAGRFINFDEKFSDFPIERTLFYSVLLSLVRLFGPALLFGTLEYLGLYMRNFIGPSFQENKT